MKVFAFGLLLLLTSSVWSYQVIESCEEAPESGIYTLKFKQWTLDVECDMDTDGGGWLIILVRRGGYYDFYKPWEVYSEDGIGTPETEYVLPLKFIHDFLSDDRYELLEELKEGSEYGWGFYSQFAIDSEENKFAMTKGSFDPASTNGGDAMKPSGTKFTTYDSDNDQWAGGNCAIKYRNAGWFTGCFQQNPFGNYQNNNDYAKGIVHNPWKGYYTSLDSFSWKVRRGVCSQGFGSTCTKCIDGFHLPSLPLFRRNTCLRDCEMEGCQKCVEAFYPECKVCNQDYALGRDGKCHKEEEPTDPDIPDIEEEEKCNRTLIINKQTTVQKLYIGL